MYVTLQNADHQILEATLPVLQTLEPLYHEALTNPACPDVEVRNYDWFRLHFREKYTMDIRVISKERIMLTDSRENHYRDQQETHKDTKDVATVWTNLQQHISPHLPTKTKRGSNHDSNSPYQNKRNVIILTKENNKYLKNIIEMLI